ARGTAPPRSAARDCSAARAPRRPRGSPRTERRPRALPAAHGETARRAPSGGSVRAHRVDEPAQLAAGRRQPVLDARRARVDDATLQDALVLELGEPLRERARRDPLERHLELVEADGALLGRGPEDREHPAAPEEVRRAGDLLGHRTALPTAHAAAASASAPARARAPRRASSPDGTTSPHARPRARPRGRRGCAPG